MTQNQTMMGGSSLFSYAAHAVLALAALFGILIPWLHGGCVHSAVLCGPAPGERRVWCGAAVQRSTRVRTTQQMRLPVRVRQKVLTGLVHGTTCGTLAVPLSAAARDPVCLRDSVFAPQ